MKDCGDRAEHLAATFLERHGLKLVAQNYRCRFGEIDLILKDRGTLVFAEVRLRQNERFGGAAASVTAQKRARLLRTAQCYLGDQANQPPCRFDVVLLNKLDEAAIEWIKSAFGE